MSRVYLATEGGSDVHNIFGRVSNIRRLRCQSLKEHVGIDVTVAPEFDVEHQWLHHCFDKAMDARHPSFLLVAKDSISSVAESRTIGKVVDKIIDKHAQLNWDIVYLCKWMDRADLYTDFHDLDCGNNLKLVKTSSPHGFHCMLISPQGCEKLKQLLPVNEKLDYSLSFHLNQLVSNGQLSAYTTTPNLIAFDVRSAQSDFELTRLSECREIPLPVKAGKKTKGSMALFWLVIVVLIVVFIIWAIVKYGNVGKLTQWNVPPSRSVVAQTYSMSTI